MLDKNDLRAWMVANGYGKRGRVSRDAIVKYLLQKPQTLRTIATNVGVAVGTRGRISRQVAEAVAAKI